MTRPDIPRYANLRTGDMACRENRPPHGTGIAIGVIIGGALWVAIIIGAYHLTVDAVANVDQDAIGMICPTPKC